MSEELILKIKDKLDITFNDDDYERKIIGIIEDAIPVLRSLFGMPDDLEFDWTEPGQERTLLKNYCLYDLNNVTEQFKDNYRNDLIQMRIKYETKNKVENDSKE